MLGVLGGMGPMATADFLRKLVEATPATCDQDHLETITLSAAAIPCRIAAIEGRGPDPLPAMVAGLRRLEAAGATRLVIPCNTAHHWYGQLQAATALPILHIVDAVVAAMARKAVPKGPVGLLATRGTLRSGLYPARLAAHGYLCRPSETMDALTRAIDLVKANRVGEAAVLFRQQVETLLAGGCSQVVLACTEIPLTLADADDLQPLLVDTTDALAQACVAVCLAERPSTGPREAYRASSVQMLAAASSAVAAAAP